MDHSHLVLIPTYNTGPRLKGTVLSALAAWPVVWVLVDGSTDGSDASLEPLLSDFPSLKVLYQANNGGKGAAVLSGVRAALEQGFTHALVMDADGQHPGDSIRPLMSASESNPDSVVMGQPIFGPEVPKARLYGRRLTIFWTDLETLWAGLGDTLFGMRVYPLKALAEVMEETHHARGYDFDPEVAVRLVWKGVRPVQVKVPVRYFSAEEGGVSHFHYLRDNVKLTCLQFRMMFAFIVSGGCLKVWRAKKAWGV